MQLHINKIDSRLQTLKTQLQQDKILSKDIDFAYDFIMPYSKAENVTDVKAVIIGQDPTILNGSEKLKHRQRKITSTLDLENMNSPLRRYCLLVCERLGFDIDKEVYATNLCKCVFREKPAYNGLLDKHAEKWIPLLKEELNVFSDKVIFITLGEPLIKQLVVSNKKKVKYYWDYIGDTKSNKNFKFIDANENVLQKRLYPMSHQPAWSKNMFYRTYLNDYLKFIELSH
jgi:hypothetical protein